MKLYALSQLKKVYCLRGKYYSMSFMIQYFRFDSVRKHSHLRSHHLWTSFTLRSCSINLLFQFSVSWICFYSLHFLNWNFEILWLISWIFEDSFFPKERSSPTRSQFKPSHHQRDSLPFIRRLSLFALFLWGKNYIIFFLNTSPQDAIPLKTDFFSLLFKTEGTNSRISKSFEGSGFLFWFSHLIFIKISDRQISINYSVNRKISVFPAIKKKFFNLSFFPSELSRFF